MSVTCNGILAHCEHAVEMCVSVLSFIYLKLNSPNIITCRQDRKVSCVDPVGIAICSQARKAFYPEQGKIPQPLQRASQLLYQLSYPVDSSVYSLFLYITVKSLATYMCIITTLITDKKRYAKKDR